ncbi:MAG: hypothetical protein Fur0010_05380 [Bdellovibrio sp.]
MKFFILLSTLLLIFSCKKEAEHSSVPTTNTMSAVASEQSFSDLEKKDESCDSEEELKKKMEEELKKAQAQPSLQGFKDAGCDVK